MTVLADGGSMACLGGGWRATRLRAFVALALSTRRNAVRRDGYLALSSTAGGGRDGRLPPVKPLLLLSPDPNPSLPLPMARLPA